MEQFGKTIFIIGIVLSLLGLFIWLRENNLSWFGNLPGDIKIEKENFKIYIPLTSMLLASILISLIIWIINRFKN